MRQFGGTNFKSYANDGSWPFWGRVFLWACLGVIVASVVVALTM